MHDRRDEPAHLFPDRACGEHKRRAPGRLDDVRSGLRQQRRGERPPLLPALDSVHPDTRADTAWAGQNGPVPERSGAQLHTALHPADHRALFQQGRRVHRDMPRHLRGPLLAFWVFHVVRDYAHTLTERGSRHAPRLPGLLAIAEELEAAVGPVEVVFGHNDLLPANFIDDGERIWLIDWDYAGWNSPLFDLANLASNAEFDHAAEEHLLAEYFGRPPDARLWKSYTAMKCASLLRETLWGMVSEITSQLAFDYAAYTADYLARFTRADEARKAVGV